MVEEWKRRIEENDGVVGSVIVFHHVRQSRVNEIKWRPGWSVIQESSIPICKFTALPPPPPPKGRQYEGAF
jgi:hypothetical protein